MPSFSQVSDWPDRLIPSPFVSCKCCDSFCLSSFLRVYVTFNTATLVVGYIGSEYDDSDVEIAERRKRFPHFQLPHAPNHENNILRTITVEYLDTLLLVLSDCAQSQCRAHNDSDQI